MSDKSTKETKQDLFEKLVMKEGKVSRLKKLLYKMQYGKPEKMTPAQRRAQKAKEEAVRKRYKEAEAKGFPDTKRFRKRTPNPYYKESDKTPEEESAEYNKVMRESKQKVKESHKKKLATGKYMTKEQAKALAKKKGWSFNDSFVYDPYLDKYRKK